MNIFLSNTQGNNTELIGKQNSNDYSKNMSQDHVNIASILGYCNTAGSTPRLPLSCLLGSSGNCRTFLGPWLELALEVLYGRITFILHYGLELLTDAIETLGPFCPMTRANLNSAGTAQDHLKGIFAGLNPSNADNVDGFVEQLPHLSDIGKSGVLDGLPGQTGKSTLAADDRHLGGEVDSEGVANRIDRCDVVHHSLVLVEDLGSLLKVRTIKIRRLANNDNTRT